MPPPNPASLVLCTGNSCRSQLLPGYLASLLAGRAGAAAPKLTFAPSAVNTFRTVAQ